jgi:hypothetical protein
MKYLKYWNGTDNAYKIKFSLPNRISTNAVLRVNTCGPNTLVCTNCPVTQYVLPESPKNGNIGGLVRN